MKLRPKTNTTLEHPFAALYQGLSGTLQTNPPRNSLELVQEVSVVHSQIDHGRVRSGDQLGALDFWVCAITLEVNAEGSGLACRSREFEDMCHAALTSWICRNREMRFWMLGWVSVRRPGNRRPGKPPPANSLLAKYSEVFGRGRPG